jgi:hypothetical protein
MSGSSDSWFGRHELRVEMVPRFLPLDLAKKVSLFSLSFFSFSTLSFLYTFSALITQVFASSLSFASSSSS